MAAFVPFYALKEALAEKAHNLGSDQIVVALCAAASAPDASADALLADITTIAYTNLSSRNVTTASSGLSGANYVLALTDLTLTASGGAVAAYRYVVLYNDTSTGDALIGYYDLGAEYTLADGMSMLLNFAASTITLS